MLFAGRRNGCDDTPHGTALAATLATTRGGVEEQHLPRFHAGNGRRCCSDGPETGGFQQPVQAFQGFSAGVFRQIRRDQRHRTVFENPLVQPREDLLRTDFEEQVDAVGRELLNQLHVPHRCRQLLDQIVPHGFRTAHVVQRHTAEELQLWCLDRRAFQRRAEGRFRFGEQRRVIRPGNGKHPRCEAFGFKQPLHAVDRIRGATDHGLIGGVVAGEICRTGEV